jgi:hypothetical protein
MMTSATISHWIANYTRIEHARSLVDATLTAAHRLGIAQRYMLFCGLFVSDIG